MPPLYKGETQIVKRYKGDTEIAKVYKGDQLYYSSGNVVTLTLPSDEIDAQESNLAWAEIGANLALGTTLSVDGQTELFFQRFALRRNNGAVSSRGQVTLQLNATSTGVGQVDGPEFSDQMEASGTITIRGSDDETIVLSGIGDATEPYQWMPANASAVAAFADRILGLTDRTLTITFNDNP